MTPSVDTPNPRERRSLVVVGAGMAAYALLRGMARREGLADYAVTLLGEEPRPCYDRVNLTDCFFDRSPDDLLLAQRAWYEEHGIEVRTNDRVAAIDRSRGVVTTDRGETLPYERLVLATGSRPFVPPIPGVDLPGVFVYRTVEDVQRIREYASSCKTAAVLGGGLLGLEAGKALLDLGLESHVVDVAPHLMPRQLNAECADLLKEEVQKLGVTVHLLRRASEIEAVGPKRRLHFGGPDPLEVDMVVVSSGIRPRDELGREAGLACGQRGGIEVDSRLRTTDPRIHAVGECASVDGELYGLVGPCYEMADVVAANLVAEATSVATDAAFSGAWTGTRLKLMGVDVATLGLPVGESAGAAPITHRAEGHSRTVFVKDRRLVGAIGVGSWPERERLSAAVDAKQRVSQLQRWRFQKTGAFWPEVDREAVARWPAKATICGCLGVTRGELSRALADGAIGADGLAEATGASTVCGSCRDLVCELAGQPAVSDRPKGRRGLLVGSAVALTTIVAGLAIGPAPSAETVQSSWRAVDALWRDSFAKQVTGYTLLVISLLALALSLRKRVSWVRLGDFGSWRGVHGLVGAATLIGFVVHTGMRLGHNFTLALAVTFLMLNLLGTFTGIVASIEAGATGAVGRRLRAVRPKLAQLHIWLFWPMPVLVVFHIISVYYY